MHIDDALTYSRSTLTRAVLPSGLLSPRTENLIGTGCVVHIPGFFKELEAVKSKGLDTTGRIKISSRAHVVFRLHQVIDGMEEAALGKGSIGTTKRGIGPTYSAKSARAGIRMGEIFDKTDMDARLRTLAANASRLHGAGSLKAAGYDVEEEIRAFDGYRERMREFVIDHIPLMQELQQKKEPILVEGANACLLDIDWGLSSLRFFRGCSSRWLTLRKALTRSSRRRTRASPARSTASACRRT